MGRRGVSYIPQKWNKYFNIRDDVEIASGVGVFFSNISLHRPTGYTVGELRALYCFSFTVVAFLLYHGLY